jgi:hypothetical protein
MSANTPKDQEHTESYLPDSGFEHSVFTSGSLKYTAEEGGNNALPAYQEVSGAPVEKKSPLGYSVGWITIVFLNLSKMVGTGIFSTRKLAVCNVAIKISLIIFSINHFKRHWFSWPCFNLLGYRNFHSSELTECVP